MRKTITLLLLLFAINANAQNNFYIDSSIAVAGNGGSWATAFSSLTPALTQASLLPVGTKCHIYVAKGTYYTTGTQAGTDRTATFTIPRANIDVAGGYPNGGGVRNIAANPTILNGNIGNATDSSDNTYTIITIPAITATTDSIVLSGLSIINGIAIPIWTQQSPDAGGAIKTVNAECPIIIDSCSFLNNAALANGGAIYHNSLTALTIVNSTFESNSSNTHGGGIANERSGATITNCFFHNNRSGTGGAICFTSDYHLTATVTLAITNCRFIENMAGNGGALYEYSSNSLGIPSTVRNCLFTNNVANSNGGAAYFWEVNTPPADSLLHHCSFTGNRATGNGGGIGFFSNPWRFTADSCDFSQNTCGYNGGGIYLTGNNTANIPPVFAHCHITGDTAGNYGGGFYNDHSTQISNSAILGNYAQYGGAAYSKFSTLYLLSDRVCGNAAAHQGGGVFSTQSGAYFTNTLFSGNSSIERGGALYNFETPAIVTNCTFSGDSSADGNTMYNEYLGVSISNSIVYDGTYPSYTGPMQPITNTFEQGGVTGGSYSANLLFVNPLPATAAPDTGGDYQLTGCSPAIDAGDNTGVDTTLTDAAGKSRIYNQIIDLGAYEYPTSYPAPFTTQDSLCRGAQRQLYSSDTGGVWTLSNGTAGITAGGLMTALLPGTDTVTYTITGTGGCIRSVSKAIVIDTVDTKVQQAGAVLTALQAGATYQWINCSSSAVQTNATGQTFTADSNGQYAVVVSKNGCTDTSDCYWVTTLGIKRSIAKEDIRIFPNPASKTVSVATTGFTATAISITDLTGKCLQQTVPNGQNTTLPVSTLLPGLYLIIVETENYRKVYKLECVQ